jgi:hypothetical protein
MWARTAYPAKKPTIRAINIEIATDIRHHLDDKQLGASSGRALSEPDKALRFLSLAVDNRPLSGFHLPEWAQNDALGGNGQKGQAGLLVCASKRDLGRAGLSIICWRRSGLSALSQPHIS